MEVVDCSAHWHRHRERIYYIAGRWWLDANAAGTDDHWYAVDVANGTNWLAVLAQSATGAFEFDRAGRLDIAAA